MPALTYRQQVAPENFDTRIPDNGNAQTANELAAMFGHVGDQLGGMGAELSQQKGRQEGMDAGLSGKPNIREGLSAGTAYGQSYNSAAESAYVSKTQTDIAQTYDRFETENEADVEGYSAKSKAYTDQLAQSTPPMFQKQVQHMLASRHEAGLMKVQAQQKAEEDADAEGSYLGAAQAQIEATRKSYAYLTPKQGDEMMAQAFLDNREKLNTLVENHQIKAGKAARYQKVFEDGMHAQIIEAHMDRATDDLMNTARAHGITAAGKAFADLQASKDWTDEDKQKIGARYTAELGQYRAAQSDRYANDVGQLRGQLASGAYGDQYIAQAKVFHDKGAISDDELGSIYGENARNQHEQSKSQVDISQMRDSLHNGTPLDPKQDEKSKKVIDMVFQEDTKGMEQGGDRWMGMVTNYVHKNNVLPQSAESYLRTAAVSGDPTQSASAVAAIDKLTKANPASAEWFDDPKLRSFVDTYTSSMDAGVDPARAHELAYKKVYGQTDTQKKVIEQQYANDIKKSDNFGALKAAVNQDDHFSGGGWFGSAPDIPVAMHSEYENLVSQYYVSTGGSIDQSRKLANKVVLQHWGVSEVNGTKQIMKYAPERMYGVTKDDIHADLADHLKAANVDPKKVQLVPSELTDYSQGKIWNVAAPNADGFVDVLRGKDNRPLNYALPLGADFSAARRKAENTRLQSEVAKAQAKRQRYLDQQAAPTTVVGP